MKKNGIVICFALLLMVLFVCGYARCEPLMPQLRFRIDMQNQGEILNCWKRDGGGYYVFLPACAGLDQVTVELSDGNHLQINGQTLRQGMSCDIFELNEAYEYTYSVFGATIHSSITFLRSERVGAVFIDTQTKNMEYIHENKKNSEAGMIRVYSELGALDHAGKCVSISGRGNSTWEEYEKKPYNLKLSEAADLLGLGSADRWVLVANAGDDSHLRNKIVYDFADLFGLPYSPDSAWVDLYLNGEYAGLYLLCERNEVHPNRVAAGEGDSFLVSMELESRLQKQNELYISTDCAQTFSIHYPLKPDDATMKQIRQTLQSAENAIMSEDGQDRKTGRTLQQIIDLDSFARKYLIEEVFGNMDAFYLSQYYYVDANAQTEKLFAGPVWDYDLSMGNRYLWQLSSPRIMLAARQWVRGGVETPWMHALCQKEAFEHEADRIFLNEMLPLLEQLLDVGLTEYAYQIRQAARMNQCRWPEINGDFDAEVAYIRQYMLERVTFLKEIWIEDASYIPVIADNTYHSNYGYFMVPEGACPTELPVLADTPESIFGGWIYGDTHEPLDPEKPVTEALTVYAQWEKTGSQKFGMMLELMPIGILTVFFLGFLAVDVIRFHRKGQDRRKI